jgi:hypothetical protein
MSRIDELLLKIEQLEGELETELRAKREDLEYTGRSRRSSTNFSRSGWTTCTTPGR